MGEPWDSDDTLEIQVLGSVQDGASWGSGVKRDAYVPLRLFGKGADQNAPFPYDRFRFRVESLDEVKQTQKIIQAIVERRHPDQNVHVRSSLTGTK